MPFENEYANTASISRIFNDEQLQDKIQSIHSQMTDFDLDETEVEFKNYNSTTDLDNYDKIIAIDGSISPTIEIDNIPYRLVRLAIVEIDPEKHIKLNTDQTYDFDTLYNIAENITEINLPFLDFKHPESSTQFDTFVRTQLNDITLYEDTIEDILESTTRIHLRENGSYEMACKDCGTTQQVRHINVDCHNPTCTNSFDRYTPLQFFNGYRPEEFMIFMENLALLDVMTKEGNCLILKDGPLAQSYTPSGYIKTAFQYLYQLPNREIETIEFSEPSNEPNFVLGIEKSGRFQTLLDDIDLTEISKPAVAPLPTDALTNPGEDGSLLYGEPTHFGKRFFICPYETARYTVYVPRLPHHEDEELLSAVSDYEPEIEVAVKVVTQYMSPRYNNSLFPVIIANQHASLPKNARYEHYLKRTLTQ